MNIPPVNARSDALPTLRGEKLTAEMLSVKIDQLLNLLERKDISPQQRETLIRTLTALQQERTLLSQLASGAKIRRQQLRCKMRVRMWQRLRGQRRPCKAINRL